MFGDFFLAYRAIKEQRAKEQAIKRLISKDPDYGIIQTLINQARVDVVATLTFPNGTKLDLRKADAFDKIREKILDPERAGAY
jgi:hypothetical protein